MPEPKLRTVRLLASNLAFINVREWGLPHLFIGKVWRSEKHRLMVCVMPHTDSTVRLQTRAVLIVDRPEQQWIPQSWRAAMMQYKREWPASAPRLWRMP